jgi:hypothetical protein
VDDLAEYLDLIVKPTFEEFKRNPISVRLAYLACVATYHAVDRAAYPGRPRAILERWRKQSLELRLVEIVALHFKHVKIDDARRPPPKGTLRITHALGLDGDGEHLELRNLYFVVRDAIKFLGTQSRASTVKRSGSGPSSMRSQMKIKHSGSFPRAGGKSRSSI